MLFLRVSVALAVMMLFELDVRADDRLDAFIVEALERNPRVLAAASRYEAALDAGAVASTLPDPVFGITQFLSPIETRVGPQSTVLSISQAVPWFGTLGSRAELAEHEAAAMEEMVLAERAETVMQVKHAYYELGFIDEALATTREGLELLRHYEALARARYAQGVGLQQAVIKLQAEVTQELNQVRVLERQRVDAEVTLNALRDRAPETPIETVSLGVRPEVDFDLDKLYEAARHYRPELRASSYRIEKTEQALDLAHRTGRPGFTVGAAWTNVLRRRDIAGELTPPEDDGKNAFSLSLGVKLPLFSGKYDAGVRESAGRVAAARSEHHSNVRSVEASVRAVSFRIQTLDEQLALYENALLPQSEQALTSSEAAYSTGTVGVLDLLDSERMLLEVRLGRTRLQADFLRACAELERVVGQNLHEVST